MSTLDRLRPHTDLTVLKAPSGPGLWLAFGTWRGRADWPRPIIPYAAGKGITRENAERACLGEMAEHLSIGVRAHDPAALKVVPVSGNPYEVDARQVLVHDLDDPDDPGSEGVAAGETLEQAIDAALCERLERIARRRWWAEEEQPRPIAEGWLRGAGLRAYEASLRGPMAGRWRASFYLIGTGLPLETVAAITEGPEGRSLGTAAAADPADAARRALNEAILEEVPLLTAAGKGNDALEKEENENRRRSYRLERVQDRTQSPCRPDRIGSLRAAIRRSAMPALAVDLTLPSLSVCVVRLILSDPAGH